MYHLTALVTLLAIAFYFFTAINVSRSRTKTGVKVPAMSGHPDFERAFRIQMNTLEWMPIFLPALWLFAIYAARRTMPNRIIFPRFLADRRLIGSA